MYKMWSCLRVLLCRVCRWWVRQTRPPQRPLQLGKSPWCVLPNPVTICRSDPRMTHRVVLPHKPRWLSHLLSQALMSTPLGGLCPTDLGVPYVVVHDSENRQYFFGGLERIELPAR